MPIAEQLLRKEGGWDGVGEVVGGEVPQGEAPE